MSQESVEYIYDGKKLNRTERQQIIALCESHERLRAELHGSEILRAEDELKIKQLEAKIANLEMLNDELNQAFVMAGDLMRKEAKQ